MNPPLVIHWPDDGVSQAKAGSDWLTAARLAGFSIPTGCLGGSCGACEIQVNGELLRACISNLPSASSPGQPGQIDLWVELASDPYW